MGRVEPPTYSPLPDTQLLIIPSRDAVQFQNGFLGVDETSSVEGEVHVKGAKPGEWARLTISFVTIERDQTTQVPLINQTVTLFDSLGSSTPGTSSNIAANLPTISYFCIPLTSDTPQAVRTPHSALNHQLIATLIPTDVSKSPLITPQDVEIHRYSSADPALTPLMPQTYTLNSPTRIELQTSRNTYRIGDIIPIYITIPVPDSRLVLETGMRLRNVKAELVRTITSLSRPTEPEGSDSSISSSTDAVSEYSFLSGDIPPSTSSSAFDTKAPSRHSDQSTPYDGSPVYKTTFARSGAAARFHSSRAIRLRLLLRASPNPSSPTQHPVDSISALQGSVECPITQQTTLHSVDFSLRVTISFISHQRQPSTSRVPQIQETAEIATPVTLLPPLARRPETIGDQEMENSYHKKFDKPPTQTNRELDADVGPPGPSASGAPPPFEEREAPPPPFVQSDPHRAHVGSSNLPSFLESEAHYAAPSNLSQSTYAAYTPAEPAFAETQMTEQDPDHILEIEGEGIMFGFRPEEQFDGLEASFGGGAEPPPAIENVQGDTDVTALAELVDQPERALEAIGRSMGVNSVVGPAYDNHPEIDNLEHALGMATVEAPAPPFTDDPADPPPGIDQEFRTSPPPFPPPGVDDHILQSRHSLVDPPPPIEDGIITQPLSNHEVNNTSADAEIHGAGEARPPPYLNSPPQGDGQHGPPPYVDLRPHT